MKYLHHSSTLLAAALLATAVQAQTQAWVSLATAKLKLDTACAANIYVTDINNDHYPDFLTLKGSWAIGAEDALNVYLNIRDTSSSAPGARMFVDITGISGANAMPVPDSVSRGTIVAVLADVNNDGNIDLIRGNYYHRLESFTDYGDRCEVLLGDGTGHFTLVHNGLSGLGLVNTTGFSLLDYDRDGNIDLFVATWFKDYNNDVWDHGYLMKGNGDGTFTNVTAQAGITQTEPMYGCSVVDWNNDGWPDIATAPYCRTPGQLWRNNGNGSFTNVAAQTGYNARYRQGDGGQNLCMWSNVPEDFDNDGDMDFFFSLVHGGADAGEGRSVMVLNGGKDNDYKLTADIGRMTRKSPQSTHLGDYDGSWFDLDNDGLIDLVMAQGHYQPATDRIYIFRQDQDHSFTDITGELGLIRQETHDLHLLEVLDFDLDGDDDVVICKDAPPRNLNLIENLIGQDNNWTGIRLRAPGGVNKSCIGARIYVWSDGLKRMREVYAGRGNNGGQQPFMMLFGLGGHTGIDSVMVVWPDKENTTTTIVRPPINRYLEITSGGLFVPDKMQESITADLKLYPNPAHDFILVQLSDNSIPERVEVYDMLGRNRQDATVYNSGGTTLYCALAGLAPGQYLMKVSMKNGETFSRSFIKER